MAGEDGNYFYNAHRLEDVGGPRGLKQVGTEHIAEIGFFTRGILIDITALGSWCKIIIPIAPVGLAIQRLEGTRSGI